MRLVVGRLGRAHGVHGEATVEVRTDLPEERFYEGAKLWLAIDSTGAEKSVPVEVESFRYHNGILLLKLAGVNDRTAVERMRNQLLLADVDLAEELAEDEFHVQQLFGLVARDLSGADLGQVKDVINLPSQDLLVISRPNGKDLMVPFVLSVVPEVNISAGYLLINPPNGLLELNDENA
jgi:16S rRNA processing protein RimM